MMHFRPYALVDIDPVVEIFRSNIPKYFGPIEEPGLRNFLYALSGDPAAGESGRDVDYFVGELDAEVVAAGGIALNDDQTVSLCWGMVRSDLIGKGLGRELTDFRIQRAREKFGSLPLVISTSQHTAGFYEKFGFRLTSHQPDGFGPGIDTCKMRLDP